jgi:hypothetical protein
MKKILLLVLSILLNYSYAQNFIWAKSFGGLNNDAGRVVCTDPSGNVIVAGGYFAPSMQIGTVTINSLGGGDVFLAKYDPQGNLLWVQTIGGTGLEVVGGICTSTNGAIFISGSYDSPALTIATSSLSQQSTIGNFDMFIAQFSTTGGLQWATRVGSTGSETAKGVTYASSTNNVLLTGYYNSPTLGIGPTTLTNTSSGSYDIFVAKYNATFGTAAGGFSTGGANANDYGVSIREDGANIYVGGSFSPISGSVSTIGASVISNGSQDVFLAKYSNANAFQWVRTGGSGSTDNFLGMDIDASGNVYTTGVYLSTPMVIGTTTLTNLGLADSYIAKYSNAGTLLWANKLSGTGSDFSNDLTLDANNNVFITGYFSSAPATIGSLTIAATTTLNSQDPFIIKLNTSGVPVWGATGKNTGYATAYAIATDAVGNIYSTGAYNLSSPLVLGTTTLSSSGNNDGYLTKIGCLTTTISGLSSVCVGNSLTLTASGASSYTWSNGANGASIVVTPNISTTYTVLGSVGTCTASGNSFNVNVVSASVNAGSDFSLLCAQNQQFSASVNPNGISSVAWTPTTGLSSASVLNPTITNSGTNVTYTVTVNFTNGCVRNDVIIVSAATQTPDICMVTTDSLGVYNEIYWDKTLYQKVDSFIIYRETSTNVFKRIGAVGKTALSMWQDTTRSLGPNNGNPKFTSYKYKLQLRDSCGNYSVQSFWHQTVFVQDQQNGNFNWNPYAIENTTFTPVSNYTLKRYNVLSGITTTVASTSANLLSDPQYTTVAQTGNVKWFVDAFGFNCNVTAKTSGNAALKNRTKSNNTNERQFPSAIGIVENSLIIPKLIVFPNPTDNTLNIRTEALLGVDYLIEIQSILGQTLLRKEVKNGNNVVEQINLDNLNQGVYFVTLIYKGKTLSVNKVIKE